MLSRTAWGKLKRDDSGRVIDRLGLLEHSIDVAAVACRLLQLPTHRRRMESLGGRQINAVDIERLGLMAFLHDLGKTCCGFQSKALDDGLRRSFLTQAGIDARGVDSGHTAILGALLHHPQRCRRLADVICVGEIESWGGLDLWLAAVSHHGRPLTFDAIGADLIPQHYQTWLTTAEYDPWENIAVMGSAARILFPMAFHEPSELLPQRPEFVHAFAGLVSLADWIGSDTRPNSFPYDLGIGLDRWPIAVRQATRLLRGMCIDVEAIRDSLVMRSPDFGEVFRDDAGRSFLPTALQTAMARDDLGPLVIAESETGSGKTEAALWRFKTLFEQGKVDSLAFLLPTRVSAVQIEQRVRSFIARLFPDKHLRPNVLLAIPGYWQVDGVRATERLPSFEVLWPDGDDEARLHKRWVAENTKRYLAACCAIGTVDQLLLSGLQARHSHLRGFAALRSLLVVDEVHASDSYMMTILENILHRHQVAGGHALLLSATLGLTTRDRLLGRNDHDAFMGEHFAPYPCITDVTSVHPLPHPDRSKSVHVELRDWLDEPQWIADLAVGAARLGGRVLVVRNTVNAAIETQRAIERLLEPENTIQFRAGPGVACLHHGRYAAADRRILDEAVESQFGTRSLGQGRVLIGTQTLEQSLDIDADLLITDLAPIDVLLQRIGRLHRHHHRLRATKFQLARVVVLTPKTRDLMTYLPRGRARHGMGRDRAYENLPSLDATWTLLEDHARLSIPEQNRELVESATDPGTLRKMAEGRGGEWTRAWADVIGSHIAGSQASAAVLCKWGIPWDASVFVDDERRIQTRLGIAALRLDLPEKWISPFGSEISELAVPRWMYDDGEEAKVISQVRQNHELILETTGGTFRYGRLGLARV